mmetsp:Transcript_63517/g.168298  ORF Transcript_63517/g.168298 Transcript_63517/m.168298 type:complete len:294 (+) Transcript_63517:157-1038(+)
MTVGEELRFNSPQLLQGGVYLDGWRSDAQKIRGVTDALPQNTVLPREPGCKNGKKPSETAADDIFVDTRFLKKASSLDGGRTHEGSDEICKSMSNGDRPKDAAFVRPEILGASLDCGLEEPDVRGRSGSKANFVRLGFFTMFTCVEDVEIAEPSEMPKSNSIAETTGVRCFACLILRHWSCVNATPLPEKSGNVSSESIDGSPTCGFRQSLRSDSIADAANGTDPQSKFKCAWSSQAFLDLGVLRRPWIGLDEPDLKWGGRCSVRRVARTASATSDSLDCKTGVDNGLSKPKM